MMHNAMHLSLCVLALVMCVCRLGTKMSKETTRGRVRLWYVLLLGGVTYLLVSLPFTPGKTAAVALISAYLLVTLPSWKNGPPRSALKRNAP